MVFQTVIGGYSSLELVSWANGTPAQLAAMLDAHYAGRINIANYWNVGDTRPVALSAIEANNCTDAMAAQTAQLVLMNFGGKTLVTAEHGETNCACVVGLKNCLTGKGCYSNASASRLPYSSSAARQFLNNQMFLALPSDLQGLFKLFVNKTTKYDSYSESSLEDSEDLLALPAAVEITGEVPSGAKAGEGNIFTYYNTAANRIKQADGSVSSYWARTVRSSDYRAAGTYITTSGAIATNGVDIQSQLGISPFGVI